MSSYKSQGCDYLPDIRKDERSDRILVSFWQKLPSVKALSFAPGNFSTKQLRFKNWKYLSVTCFRLQLEWSRRDSWVCLHMMEWITNRSRQSKQSELRVQKDFPVYSYRLKICKMERSLGIPVCKHIKDEKFLPFHQKHWFQQLSKVINSTGKRIGTNNILSSLLKCVVFPSVTNLSVCKTSRECVLLQKEKLPKMLLWEKWKSMQHHSGCY